MKSPKLSDILKLSFSGFLLMAYPFSKEKILRAISFYSRYPKIITGAASDSIEYREEIQKYAPQKDDLKWKDNLEKSLTEKNILTEKMMLWAMEKSQEQADIWKEYITRFGYADITFRWYTSLFFAIKNGDVFDALQKLVNQVIDGERPPYKIKLQLQKQTNTDLTNYLRAGDAESASLLLEKSSDSFNLQSGTAVVHLILRGEGTYALINYADGQRKILCIPEFSREAVTKVLKGWLWLYFWYRGDVREEITLDAMEMWTRNIKERPKSQLEAARDYVLYYITNPILNNQKIFEEYHLIEIPEGKKGTPYIAPPVWVLSDIYLRMIGQGYSWCKPGLWQQIYSEVSKHNVSRVIVCPDPALAILPHHAAILEIDATGRRTYLQDHYDVAYIPWGNLNREQFYPSKEFMTFGDPSVDLSNCFCKEVASINPKMVNHVSADKGYIYNKIDQSSGFFYFGHATYDWNDPLKSYININERPLLFKNLERKLKNELGLIVIAGCDAGIPISSDFSFEYENISETLLKSLKCNSMISSSWGANQLSTFLMFRQFYKILIPKLRNGESISDAVCNALGSSQKWLRNADKDLLLNELIEILNNAEGADKKEVEKWMEWMNKQYISKPFAHPYFWSSFYFTGRPS
jgi:hypothetical protein